MTDTVLFNDGWEFHRGDLPHDVALFNRGAGAEIWRPIVLPHDWSIEGPFSPHWASATGFLPGGVGWYRKTFSQPKSEGRQTLLRFDGVYCNSDVWINGRHLGHRPNGYIDFEYDLSADLHHDRPNVIAVRVDHSQFADSRWYTGSGIYRSVFLVNRSLRRFPTHGIFVTTPVIHETSAEVHVRAAVRNAANTPARIQIRHVLRDAANGVIAEKTSDIFLEAGEEAETSAVLTAANPRLWSVENPQQYALVSELSSEENVVDRQETLFGIRSIRFDAQEGFFLNGENLKFKGVCLHHDAGALGAVAPVGVWERRLRTLKAAGVNAIRMAHNPHLPALYDLCDQMGFLVQGEAFDEWEGGKNKWVEGWNVGRPVQDGYHDAFSEWGETDLRDMVRRDRNHPSVVMWSIGNEIDYPNDPYSHEILDHGTNPQIYGRGFQPDAPHANRLGEIARKLAAVVRACDPSRPVTAGLASALISNETGFADALDIVGYNYQEYRYAEDHQKYPDRVLYGSECGMASKFWRFVTDNPFVCGQFLWTGIDYLGEARAWPARSNLAGLLDLAGFPKPEYYFRQSLWSDVPMAYLTTRRTAADEETSLWSHQPGEPAWSGETGEMIRVQCFTNCEEARLWINGREVGVRSRDAAADGALCWDIPYEPGVLTVDACNHGQVTASHQLRTCGSARRLMVETDTTTLRPGGEDVGHIAVTIVDSDGVPVYDADQEITWTLDGPGRLLGLESGDCASHEEYQARRRRAFHGRLLGYIAAEGGFGEIAVRLTSPGLEEATVRLQVASGSAIIESPV